MDFIIDDEKLLNYEMHKTVHFIHKKIKKFSYSYCDAFPWESDNKILSKLFEEFIGRERNVGRVGRKEWNWNFLGIVREKK